MLKKNLSSKYPSDTVESVFEKLGIKDTARAEELKPEMFADLYKFLVSVII